MFGNKSVFIIVIILFPPSSSDDARLQNPIRVKIARICSCTVSKKFVLFVKTGAKKKLNKIERQIDFFDYERTYCFFVFRKRRGFTSFFCIGIKVKRLTYWFYSDAVFVLGFFALQRYVENLKEINRPPLRPNTVSP